MLLLIRLAFILFMLFMFDFIGFDKLVVMMLAWLIFDGFLKGDK